MIFCISEVEKNLRLRLHIIRGDVELCDPQLRQSFPNRPLTTCGDEYHEQVLVPNPPERCRREHARLPKHQLVVLRLRLFPRLEHRLPRRALQHLRSLALRLP